MILLNNLFHLRDLQHDEHEIRALLGINAQHEILSGHFPGFPVMPGVCMMQVVREVFDKAVGVPVRIVKGDNMKFLAVLDPGLHLEVRLSIAYKAVESSFEIVANLFSIDVDPDTGVPKIFFKFKGIYEESSVAQ